MNWEGTGGDLRWDWEGLGRTGSYWDKLGVNWDELGETGKGLGGTGRDWEHWEGTGSTGSDWGGLGALGSFWEHWEVTGSTGRELGGYWEHWDELGGTGSIFPPKSPFSPQNPHFSPKNPHFPPKIPIFPPKIPIFPQNSHFSPKNPHFPPQNPHFSPQIPAFSPQNPYFSPQNPHFFPQKSPFFPKIPIFPPKIPIFPPKIPISPPKSLHFPPKIPIFPPKIPIFPPKIPIFPPKSPFFFPPAPHNFPKSPFFPKIPIFRPKSCRWLHSEALLAVAQRRYLHIYDSQGLEIHVLPEFQGILRLEFLPWHFLLAAVSSRGLLRFLDVSEGRAVSSLRLRCGRAAAMAQSPASANVLLGHANGVVSMWTPNTEEPVLRLLAHRGSVRGLAADAAGRLLATSGLDRKIRIFDLRNLGVLQEWGVPAGAALLDFSQRGLLAAACGDLLQIYPKPGSVSPPRPFLCHRLPGPARGLRFCPFEDVLGAGHGRGFSSLLVPGAGEPNFDALENNPYRSRRQRQEWEVKALLEKIPAELLTPDPALLGRVDGAAMEQKRSDRIQRLGFDPGSQPQFLNSRIPNSQIPNSQILSSKIPNSQIPNSQSRNSQIPNSQIPNSQSPSQGFDPGSQPRFPIPKFPNPEFPNPEFPNPEFPNPEFPNPEFLNSRALILAPSPSS
uniref:BING4 C-terminal domain-containing protein n=1 Tax=Taeniopygia guttata TaxID=59729 RepID=A0A674H905_TAEGU